MLKQRSAIRKRIDVDWFTVDLLSVPLVDGLNIAEHHPLFATLQIVRHWNITVGISDLGDVAVKCERPWKFYEGEGIVQSLLPMNN